MRIKIHSYLESMRLHRCIDMTTGHSMMLDFTMHELFPLLEVGTEVEIKKTIPVIHSVVDAELSC